jgi:hypothetical protein
VRTVEIIGFGHFGDRPASGAFPVEAIVRPDTPRKVEFFIDGALVNTDTRYPYMLAGGRWDSRTLPNGEHRLLVRATFGDGATREARLTFRVENPAETMRLLWINGELVREPYTFTVTRRADDENQPIDHTFVIRIPSRGWDVRFTLPTAPYQVTQTDESGTRTFWVHPERERHVWITNAPDPGRFEIDRFVMDGEVMGDAWPTQGASDPCANGSWRHGDPPDPANRHGKINGVTERLRPIAEVGFDLEGVDDECRGHHNSIEFWVPVE